MLYLKANHDEKQRFYLTLPTRDKDHPNLVKIWMRFTHMTSFKRYGLFVKVIASNDRFVTCEMRTDNDNVLTGAVLMKEEGLYMYEVFRVEQDDSSTIPAESKLIGPLTSGLMRTTETGMSIADVPSIPTPENVIYYQ